MPLKYHSNILFLKLHTLFSSYVIKRMLTYTYNCLPGVEGFIVWYIIISPAHITLSCTLCYLIFKNAYPWVQHVLYSNYNIKIKKKKPEHFRQELTIYSHVHLPYILKVVLSQHIVGITYTNQRTCYILAQIYIYNNNNMPTFRYTVNTPIYFLTKIKCAHSVHSPMNQDRRPCD